MTEIGNSIEEYDVGEQLGRGGFAVVYRARCQNTGREVAIKKIDKGKIAAGGLINRVRQEVTIHSQLNHPAILKLFTFFEDQQYVYLILELCLNGELQKYIRNLRRVLTEDEAREYLSQIVSGMLHLHSHAIMHRDLTLSNLLLDNDGRIKIADFGLATQLRRPDDRHTTMCGTPNYISPEVATRSSHGLESDVWSLGCMLFIMLVGHPPFDGEGVKESIFTRVVIGDYKVPSYVSTNARSLISDCLQKNPRERIKLQTIPQHPFMNVGTKTEVSRMSDSGMYTMSTVTSANHTRMPLSVISESNVSGCENNKEGEHHLTKFHNEPLRKHLGSPPVRMKSSPRDLLPPNAGLIDNLKRKFTPLPSLKRSEDFVFATSSIPSFTKRERDVSEERRKHQQMHHQREGSSSSCEDRSDSSQYSSSHMSDDIPRHQTRGHLQRGSSEQNLMQKDNTDAGRYPLRRERSLERGSKSRDGYSRSGEYNPGYHHDIRESSSEKYINPRSRSVDRNFAVNSQQRNVESERKAEHFSNKTYGRSRQTRSRENSAHRERDKSLDDHRGGHRRSRSEDRCRETSQCSSGESSHVKYRESSRDRCRNNSQERYRDPSLDMYRDNSLERHRDKLREPEHRSYREEPVDSHKDRHHSCCQSSQHRSWCERRKNQAFKKTDSVCSSSDRLRNKDENQNFSSNFDASSPQHHHHHHNPHSGDKNERKDWLTGKGFKSTSPQRLECNNKMLGNIPPVKCIQQPTGGEENCDNVQSSTASRAHGTPTKKLSDRGNQTIQQQVSPLCSKRLKATRQRTKNAILNILDNGEICLEFFRNKQGKEKVIDVCRISPDGMRIVLYQPNGGSGSQPGNIPPPLPTEGADAIFSYENLPPKYWKKYIYAARFVKVVKAKTPKITYYSEQAKCMLMENSPDPDFEAVFYHGLKITSSGKDVVVKEVNGMSCTIPQSSAPSGLLEALHPAYLHFKEVRDHCLYLERVLTEVTDKTGLSSFPVIMGRKPPGMTTPPATARGSSHPVEDKENLSPVSLQSYKASRNAADQLGSFQESVASIQTVRSCALPVKHPLGPHTSSNIQGASPITLENPAPRVYIQDIGWATQGSNGVISVEYLDGTQVLVSSNDPKVVFTDEFKVTKTYSTSNKLPLLLQQKLSQMKIVLSSLVQPPRSSATASASHRIGLR